MISDIEIEPDEETIKGLIKTFEHKYYILSSTSRAQYEEASYKEVEHESFLSQIRSRLDQINFAKSQRFCLQKPCEDQTEIDDLFFDSFKTSLNTGEY